MFEQLWLIPLGFVAGILGSIIGLGGGIIIVPILTFMGFSPTLAVSNSLFAVFSNSVASTAMYAKQKRIELSLGWKLGLMAVPGTILGAFVSSEFSPDIFKFVTGISKVLMNCKNNFFLTIDYGYNSERYRNSLQGLMKHKKVDIFSNQGFVDITYLVNFNLIKSIFQKNKVSNINISTQSDFLKQNGIIERFNQSKKLLDSDEKISKLHLAVNRLINDKQMGSLFKVMTASNND